MTLKVSTERNKIPFYFIICNACKEFNEFYLSMLTTPSILKKQPKNPSMTIQPSLFQLRRYGDTPVGIERRTGMCDKREGSAENADVAFKITQRAVASIPTADIFPGN